MVLGDTKTWTRKRGRPNLILIAMLLKSVDKLSNALLHWKKSVVTNLRFYESQDYKNYFAGRI